MKNSGIKKFFTKRNILFLINGIFFIILVVYSGTYLGLEYRYQYLDEDYVFRLFIKDLFKYFLIQCVFTLLSLIVYYLSIMAGALNSKYKEEVKDSESKNKE